MEIVFVLLLLASNLLNVAVSRPTRSTIINEYYGLYNKCNLNIWPWPLDVECTVDRQSNKLRLNPDSFKIALSKSSRARNSTILQSAIYRYQNIIFNQPVRHSRGKFVEPQLVLEHVDDEPPTSKLSSDSLPTKLLSVLEITVEQDSNDSSKSLDDDESYEISVDGTSDIAYVSSRTIWGALYALESFSQLVEPGNILRALPLHIYDAPRYPWRGFLLDTSNHYISESAIRRLVDAMAAVKLNVLHWHIVDSYSFPYASNRFPDLSAAGAWPDSDTTDKYTQKRSSAVYTMNQIARIVAYCKDRGVRVLPEFDMPGHAFSWGLSQKYSQITTFCPAYTDELGHVDDVPLDVTRDETYEVVFGLLAELQHLFPDNYFHIGGDEVKYGCWNESATINSWMTQNGITTGDFYSLEQYFFQQVQGFAVEKLGHKLVAWEEVFFSDSGANDGAHGAWVGSPSLPASTGTVVEIWTGADYLQEARANGYDTLLAYGWYLDRQSPVDGQNTWFFGDTWAQMYGVDPETDNEQTQRQTSSRQISPDSSSSPSSSSSSSSSANTDRNTAVDASTTVSDSLLPTLPSIQRGRVLGGEVSMWTEQVDDQNIDAQVWPRAAAVAERLWSLQAITDPAAAAPRLAMLRCRLVGRYGVKAGPIWSDYCTAASSVRTNLATPE